MVNGLADPKAASREAVTPSASDQLKEGESVWILGALRLARAAALVVVLLTTLGARAEAQDVVVPTQDVTSRVVVRATASSSSADRGSLRPGEQAELLASVPSWYRVRLANGIEGFVSKRWTRVIPTAPQPIATQVSDTIDIVDVGTGLGVLIRGPTFTLVYDAGSNDDRARGDNNRMLAYIRAVAPTLSTIDHMILSHPHQDHVELLPDLFAQYQVRDVWDSGRLNDICGYRAFLTAVRDEPSVKYHTATQDGGTSQHTFAAKTCYGQALPGETITLSQSSRINNAAITLGPGASMTFLHADGAAHGGFNENSLVVRFDLGGTRILFMGDAEAGGRKDPSVPPSPQSIEGALLACCAADLAADVLVAGHHGSMTSSRRAFLDAVNPRVAIVSAGPFPYSSVTLPDSVIVAELRARAQVFRTDGNDGACALNPAKIGPDADGRPGGCDNIRIVVPVAGVAQVEVWRGAETP